MYLADFMKIIITFVVKYGKRMKFLALIHVYFSVSY